ncbi:MAG: TIGR02452 family protein [Promethearchaeota archaeon]
MNHFERIKIAQETLSILRQGYYYGTRETRIDIKKELTHSINNSILYTPLNIDKVFKQRDSLFKIKNPQHETIFEIKNESTLHSAWRLSNEKVYKNITCLNFASATNPGGGFLKGSQAQEESLARATGLYPCIAQIKEMYEANKKYHSPLYLDYIIYSPHVPVIRDDDGMLLDNPYFISHITAPAVNAKAVFKYHKSEISKIRSTIINRIKKILSIAFINDTDALILGAWGCGVFGNNPKDVSNYFKSYLREGIFRNRFKKVVFAILDRTSNLKYLSPFKKAFMM